MSDNFYVKIPSLVVHQPLDSLAKLNYSYRNKLINGAFRFWQRGPSFVGALAPIYTADRWLVTAKGAVSRGVFLPGESEAMDNSRYFLSLAATAPAGIVKQRIEDVLTSAGKRVTLTLWTRGPDGSLVNVSINQVFGTGGSPSVSLLTSVGMITLSSTWTKSTFTFDVPSVATKSVGTDDNSYLSVQFTLPVCTTNICNVQLEEGPVATNFETRTLQAELAMCQRYFCKSYSIETVPASITNLGRIPGFAPNPPDLVAPVDFPVSLRATPKITFYSPFTGLPGLGGGFAATAPETNDRVLGSILSSGLTSGDIYWFHFTAEAEL